MTHALKVGLVGYGRWGQKLAAALATLPAVELCGICDLTLTQHSAVLLPGQLRAAPAYPDLAEFLSQAQPEAVVVATPSISHAWVAQAALAAGAHVFVEKPLAMSVGQAEAVLRAARAHQRTVMVGHILHHDAAVSLGFGLLHANAIGAVQLCLAQRSNVGDRAAVVGWWELAPHDISVSLRVIQSVPHWVEASVVGNSVMATLGFGGGVTHLRVGAGPERVRRMAWVGSDGALLFEEGARGLNLYQVELASGGAPELVGACGLQRDTAELWRLFDQGVVERRAVDVPVADALRGELLHFVDCARDGRASISDGYEGLQVVRVLAAAELSLTQGRRERLLPEHVRPGTGGAVFWPQAMVKPPA